MNNSKKSLKPSVRRFAALAALLFAGCQEPSDVIAKQSMPDEKIARIMADLSIAEAATNGLNGYQKDSLMHVYFTQVFQMHGVSAEAYERDLRIIASDLQHMEEIVKKAEEFLQ